MYDNVWTCLYKVISHNLAKTCQDYGDSDVIAPSVVCSYDNCVICGILLLLSVHSELSSSAKRLYFALSTTYILPWLLANTVKCLSLTIALAY